MMLGSLAVLPMLFVFHSLFMLSTFLGLVFLIIWAAKYLKQETLKTWIVWFLVVGLVGSFLTIGGSFMGMMTGLGNGPGFMMDQWDEESR